MNKYNKHKLNERNTNAAKQNKRIFLLDIVRNHVSFILPYGLHELINWNIHTSRLCLATRF